MKVEVIGTGAIYTKYHSACTLIDEELMIDMPNGTLKQLLRNNYQPEKIRTILITHKHGDHMADLPFFLKYVQGYLYDMTNIKNELTIIGPKGIEEKVVQLFEAYGFESRQQIQELMKIKYIELDKEEYEVEVQHYKVQALQVSHGAEKPAYGYIINQSVGYTGDSKLCDNVEKIVESSKITIADTSFIKGDNSHMGINNIKYLTQKYKKPIIATHMRDKARETLQKEENENILVVEDGYQFYV